MNEDYIKKWNLYVKENDEVYHLGDISLGHPSKTKEILRRLKGKIYYIRGNHDKQIQFQDRVEWVKDYAMINVYKQPIFLIHYAMRVWSKMHYGSWCLYGHSHGSLKDDPNSLSTDVGVDCTNGYPLSFEELLNIMSKKKFVPVDHHKPRKER